MADRSRTLAAPAATPDTARSQDARARGAAGEPPAAEPALTPSGPLPPLARQLAQVIRPQHKPGAVSAPGNETAHDALAPRAAGDRGSARRDRFGRPVLEPGARAGAGALHADLQHAGFGVGGEGTAPLLRTDAAVSATEIRVSLDHIAEKAIGDNWTKALDADNLRMEFAMPNTYREIIQARHPELR